MGKTLGKGDIRPGMRKEVRRHSRWRKGHPQGWETSLSFSTSVIGLTTICDAILEGPLGWGRDVLLLMA